MAHSAQINRSNPTAFLFLIDQSGSMEDRMSTGKSKAQQVSDVLNRTLANLITRCTKADGTRDYFDVGVIAYGGYGISNGFQGELNTRFLNSISAVEASPLRIEERQKRIDDGAGGLVEQTIKFPVWFEPQASGGTPMCAALAKVAEELIEWSNSHPDSYPPTILHITDGASTDGDPEELARSVSQIQTHDGNVLMFNLHLSTSEQGAVRFPSSEYELSDSYSKLLFRMSSVLPDHIVRYAQNLGLKVGIEARGFMFNTEEIADIVDFFDIGTRATQLR